MLVNKKLPYSKDKQKQTALKANPEYVNNLKIPNPKELVNSLKP
jgi:hypothetical protein